MNDPNQVQVQVSMMNNGNHQMQLGAPEPTYTDMEPVQAPPPEPDLPPIPPHMLIEPKLEKMKKESGENKEKKKKLKTKKKKEKREAIDGQAKEIIYRVIKFFDAEKAAKGYSFPVENVMKRASAATGLSESTIKRIKRDGMKAEATNTKIPGPKKKRNRKCKVQLDYYQLCSLRSIVNNFTNRKEVPTLGKILTAAKEELNYVGGKESLRLILLNKLGIKFKKFDRKKSSQQQQQPQEQKPLVNVNQPQMPQVGMPGVPNMQQPPVQPEQKPLPMQFQPPTTMHGSMMPMHHPQPMQPSMLHPQMHPMKMEAMENCVYSSMMSQPMQM